MPRYIQGFHRLAVNLSTRNCVLGLSGGFRLELGGTAPLQFRATYGLLSCESYKTVLS